MKIIDVKFMKYLDYDLVPSIFSTMTDGGRGHFLVDPLNVERNLCEVALSNSCTPVLQRIFELF